MPPHTAFIHTLPLRCLHCRPLPPLCLHCRHCLQPSALEPHGPRAPTLLYVYRYVVAGAEDGSIWRWHTRTGQALKTLRDHSGAVTAVK